MAVSHAQIAKKLGEEKSRLQNKVDKTADFSNKEDMKRIQDIDAFLEGTLRESQKAQRDVNLEAEIAEVQDTINTMAPDPVGAKAQAEGVNKKFNLPEGSAEGMLGLFGGNDQDVMEDIEVGDAQTNRPPLSTTPINYEGATGLEEILKRSIPGGDSGFYKTPSIEDQIRNATQDPGINKGTPINPNEYPDFFKGAPFNYAQGGYLPQYGLFDNLVSGVGNFVSNLSNQFLGENNPVSNIANQMTGGLQPQENPLANAAGPPTPGTQSANAGSYGAPGEYQPPPGYKVMHDAYYDRGGEIPKYGRGGEGVGINTTSIDPKGILYNAPMYDTLPMFSQGGGGFFSGDGAYNAWNKGRDLAGNIPALAPYHAIGKMGESMGLSEFADPFGAQLKFLQRDPETGKMDTEGLLKSLLFGPFGSFFHNKKKGKSSSGGGAAEGGGGGGLFGGGGGGLSSLFGGDGGGLGGLFGMEQGGHISPHYQYANGGYLPQHGLGKFIGNLMDPLGIFPGHKGIFGGKNQNSNSTMSAPPTQNYWGQNYGGDPYGIGNNYGMHSPPPAPGYGPGWGGGYNRPYGSGTQSPVRPPSYQVGAQGSQYGPPGTYNGPRMAQGGDLPQHGFNFAAVGDAMKGFGQKAGTWIKDNPETMQQIGKGVDQYNQTNAIRANEDRLNDKMSFTAPFANQMNPRTLASMQAAIDKANQSEETLNYNTYVSPQEQLLALDEGYYKAVKSMGDLTGPEKIHAQQRLSAEKMKSANEIIKEAQRNTKDREIARLQGLSNLQATNARLPLNVGQMQQGMGANDRNAALQAYIHNMQVEAKRDEIQNAVAEGKDKAAGGFKSDEQKENAINNAFGGNAGGGGGWEDFLGGDAFGGLFGGDGGGGSWNGSESLNWSPSSNPMQDLGGFTGSWGGWGK